jgi:hypothetical protein
VKQVESHDDVIDLVTQWRLRQLLEARVQYGTALPLAETTEDLHQMIAAKERGCPDDLLLQIYLP